jgi:hypothetical protein
VHEWEEAKASFLFVTCYTCGQFGLWFIHVGRSEIAPMGKDTPTSLRSVRNDMMFWRNAC